MSNLTTSSPSHTRQQRPQSHTSTTRNTRIATALKSPFGSGDRDDFPDFDQAFGEVHGKDHEDERRRRQRRQRRRLHPPNDPNEHDHSFSSVASSQPTNSSLDMSIGARAALTEHLRHIARYGLDGQPSSQGQQQQRRQQEYLGEVITPKRNRNPLDEEWDRLMDQTNTSNASPWQRQPQQQRQRQQLYNNTTNTSFSSGSRQQINDESTMSTIHTAPIHPVMSVSEDGHEAFEVMTDLSTDFFNSSRVNLLATPEKNKGLIRAVVTRDDTSHYDDEDDDDDDEQEEYDEDEDGDDDLISSASGAASIPSQSNSLTRINLFRDDVNTTFLSAVDLSRISGSDSSEVIRRSPNVSFQSPRHQHPLHLGRAVDDEFLLSPSIPPHFSPQVATAAAGTASVSLKRPPITYQPPTPQRTPSPRKQMNLQQQQRKLEGRSGSEVETLPFETLSLSPIASKAGSAAARLLQQHNKRQRDAVASSFYFYDRGANLLFDTSVACMGSADHSSPPRIPEKMTPSLGVGGPPSLSRRNSPQWHGVPTRTTNLNSSRGSNNSSNTSGTSQRNNSSPSPVAAVQSDPSSHLTSSSLTNSSSTTNSIDRRRYRTVVPSRVFLVEPTEFPMQEDSFSGPWNNTGTTEESIHEQIDGQENEHKNDENEDDVERRRRSRTES